MRPYIAELTVQNGEYKHSHKFLIDKGGCRRATRYAKEFYGTFSSRDGDAFFFNAGEVATQITSCRPITAEEFAVLKKFLDVV